MKDIDRELYEEIEELAEKSYAIHSTSIRGQQWTPQDGREWHYANEAYKLGRTFNFQYDELTEQYIAELDDKTVLIIAGGNRGKWAKELGDN